MRFLRRRFQREQQPYLIEKPSVIEAEHFDVCLLKDQRFTPLRSIAAGGEYSSIIVTDDLPRAAVAAWAWASDCRRQLPSDTEVTRRDGPLVSEPKLPIPALRRSLRQIRQGLPQLR